MARSKPKLEIAKITSLREADEVLHRIADLRAEIRKHEADADIAVNRVKEELKQKVEPLLKNIEALEKSLAVYSEYNKEDLFRDKKTIELTFGLFGFRQSTSISVKKDTLELLKQHGFNEAIKIKETVNKEIMREWSDERLSLVHAKRVVKDLFWIETKENDVETQSA
ncbi:host-nuclease inhibitor Gam family protein [Hydrogenimonas thermophila]|uniref:host-nuclease inhibitor Gam family protein n=1 Tax=Hydrogenimonas thermophila TaxID=223786 RepID=UPI00293749AB|nr:host-nuclease inhibitor Gam family protein [Hydrogenimonas thermophila]WOE69117.1 host-nuclease inhibitor Gam family protein [Hydrogenimonas thermophila]WOE71627.1 host-nuclease inhibitor Gam family protein [Hydrogenimonas thermophila]